MTHLRHRFGLNSYVHRIIDPLPSGRNENSPRTPRARVARALVKPVSSYARPRPSTYSVSVSVTWLLHQELGGVYRAIAHSLFVANQRPVLAVDWSDFECGKGRQWAMIKAAAPAGGRAVVLYARVFPFKKYNSPGAHREFLRGLKAVLPELVVQSWSPTPAFAGPGLELSRRSDGIGSAESETRTPGAGGAGGALTPCLERPNTLPRPPTVALPCELISPRLRR
jgi:hypothetical protein